MSNSVLKLSPQSVLTDDMRRPLLLFTLHLAAFLSADVLAQNQVQIQFQTDPLLVQTGTEIVFTVLTTPNVVIIQWFYQETLLGAWAGGTSVLNPVAQFEGRVTILSTQLKIGGAQLRDAGDYSVQVTPRDDTGLLPNTRSIRLSVFDAVAGVSLSVPTLAMEDGNVSLSCTWTAGTDLTVQWGKGGQAISSDSRITIEGGSLVINPARRGDAGDYTCTVSNPVSARTVSASLTVYYGPDSPVVTKDVPKDCVGGGDVLVGQTVRITCTSNSLPPALFSWTLGGQSVASGQPDSGVLSLQTLSTDEGGRYVCTARNAITLKTAEQGTNLSIVDVCLSGGEVAGIVIGSFLLLLILILLIILLVKKVVDQRRRRDELLVPKNDRNPRPPPPDPQPNGARDLGPGPLPPLYTHARNPDRFHGAPQETRNVPQTVPPNRVMHGTDTLARNNRTRTHSHSGIENPAFTRTDAPNLNAVSNVQQQNPNIVIQAGTSQGASQPPAVQVNLPSLPQSSQQNNSAPMPTIHVNLNSYPGNGQQQGNSFPLNSLANNTAQVQQTLTEQSHTGMQIGQSNPSNARQHANVDAGHQSQAGLIPTGFTHHNSSNVVQRNANTQTDQRNLGGPDRNRQDEVNSSHRQMPWDRLRGTPAYPAESPTMSDSTDYTTHAPIQQTRTFDRTQPGSRTELRQEESSRSREADVRGAHTLRIPQLEPARRSHSSPQRDRTGADIRDVPARQTGPGQEGAHSNNPQALPLMSQQAAVDHAALSQRPLTQPNVLHNADTRALADPNHLQQTLLTQQPRVAVTQRQPTQTVARAATQPAAPTPNPSNLTEAALRSHTQASQTFQNRRQQTQAALLHPGPQVRATAVAQQPPIPPPVIPLAQFQSLPKERTQHRSPARGPQPPRPPVNIPVAQRPRPVHHHRSNVPHHPAGPHHHHHHPHHHGNAALHRPTHQRQQTHRGRPR
ncbi:putative uncharacterized protein DDB_G0291608 isoform X2 [Synchiropus splendidus]|uniref:putative uncharacterized protein DDB_G0291608 isoform X2 n=1 Tax=Synchiropus splendidus TaxID=270530 RepID=UPI00237EC523|nr:putative uncharacterized protein DDB_G0291608 isoform X2 [Synchiropus splendidus]